MVGVHGGRSHKVAAKHADMVVTNSSTRESAAEYRRALDRALVEQGRTPGSVPPIPGLIPYLGRTTKEAGDRLAELDSFVDLEPIAPFTLGQFGLDIRYGDIDDPFPTHEPVQLDLGASRLQPDVLGGFGRHPRVHRRGGPPPHRPWHLPPYYRGPPTAGTVLAPAI